MQGFPQPIVLDLRQEHPHHHPHRAEINIYLSAKHEKFINNIDFKERKQDRNKIDIPNNVFRLENKGLEFKDGRHHHSPEVEIYANPEPINFKSPEVKDHENRHHHRLEAEIGLKILPFPNINITETNDVHRDKHIKPEVSIFTTKNPCIYKIEKKNIQESHQSAEVDEVIKNPYGAKPDVILLKEKPHIIDK